MDKNSGIVIWITGLSSAGKTTIARAAHELLQEKYKNSVLLDGDSCREVFGNDLGHTVGDRKTNAFRICRLCKLLSEQGIHVICSTMSLFPEVWEWNRLHLSKYFEVYLKVELSVLRSRDPKGIYARSERGEESNVIGADLPFEKPPAPDLTIENNLSGEENIKSCAKNIISAAKTKFQLS